MSSLGDRIKGYEGVFRPYLVKRMPVMVRVDGKAFHTLTKDCEKPFDASLINAMVVAAEYVAEEIQGFKAAYVQSDEATFCFTDYDTLQTQGWFNYNVNKIVSLTAASMTAHFNRVYSEDKVALFDSRAFNVPKDDVVNAFLWRAQDWGRNSLQMYSRANFSHKELHKKDQIDMHNMLHSIGRNWTTDLTDREKNGTFIIKGAHTNYKRCDVIPTYNSINAAIGELF